MAIRHGLSCFLCSFDLGKVFLVLMLNHYFPGVQARTRYSYGTVRTTAENGDMSQATHLFLLHVEDPPWRPPNSVFDRWRA